MQNRDEIYKKAEEEYLAYLKNIREISDSSASSYRSDIHGLMDFAKRRGCVTFDDINRAVLSEYINEQKQLGKKRSSIQRSIGSIRGYFKFLFGTGYILVNYADELEFKPDNEDIPKIRFLTEKEVKSLFEAADNLRDRVILEMIYAAGLKSTELISLKIEDLDLQISCCVIQSNTENERIVPFGTNVRDLLMKYLHSEKVRIEDEGQRALVFVSKNGKGLSRQSIWKIVRRCGDRAGIKNCSPEILRAAFAVQLLQTGTDVRSVQSLMGHANISTTRRYENIQKTEEKK